MSPQRIRSTFWLDPEHVTGLKQLKARDGIPEGESVRRALTDFLKRKGIKAAKKGSSSK